jgi:NADH dehydrogenase
LEDFSMNEPHVVILGAGFAGIGAMRKLKDAPVQVTLIDKNDFHTFQPLLYQVATAELAHSEVGFPVREMLHDHPSGQFHQTVVTGIDLAQKQVMVEGMEPLAYDYLVIALGAVVNYFGVKGADDHAFPLYTMQNANRLKAHILHLFEAVDKDPALIDDGALTFCVVGGGPTGVETAGAIAEMLHAELKEDYPNLPVERGEVHLYEASPHLLGPFKANLQAYAKKELEEIGVQVHLGEGVVEIEPTRIHLKSGGVVKTHTLVWGAGITGNPLASALGKELNRGRVPVNLDLSLPDYPEVFVIGDIALITDSKTNKQLPQLGSVAQQAGFHAAENISRLVKGSSTEPFKYLDKGTMATVGRGAAIVELPNGRTMKGHAAWMAWLGVHLVLLSGGEQKSLTFVDWGWNVVTNKRTKRILVE